MEKTLKFCESCCNWGSAPGSLVRGFPKRSRWEDRGAVNCFFSCWAYLPGERQRVTDVFTWLLLNFDPLLQQGSWQKGQAPGPRAGSSACRPGVSSVLQPGERCQCPHWLALAHGNCVMQGEVASPWRGECGPEGARLLSSGCPGLWRDLQHCLGHSPLLLIRPVCPRVLGLHSLGLKIFFF